MADAMFVVCSNASCSATITVPTGNAAALDTLRANRWTMMGNEAVCPRCARWASE